MSLNEKLSKLGFKDVFEIVPGLIYEFISNGRRIRMSVGNAIGPRVPSAMGIASGLGTSAAAPFRSPKK
jgi:hypothetical protein